MAMKIGKTSIPDDAIGLMKHRELSKVLHEYCVKQMAQENTAFLNAVHTRKGIPVLWSAFIKSGSQFEINISGTLREEMTPLGEAADWDPRKWQKPLKEAYAVVAGLVNRNFLANKSDKFWDSKQFRDYVFKKVGSPSKVARVTGMPEKELSEMMFLSAVGRDAESKKIGEKLAKKEKDKAKAAALVKALKDAGLAA